MRIALAVVLVAVILGVVQLFMWFQDAVPKVEPQRFLPPKASGDYSLEVTLSFPAEPDAFDPDAASLRVELQGAAMFERTDVVPSGEPLRIRPQSPLMAGRNEILIFAAPAEADFDRFHAVRVRVLRDDEPIAEQTLWAPPGEPIQGLVAVEVPPDAAGNLVEPRKERNDG